MYQNDYFNHITDEGDKLMVTVHTTRDNKSHYLPLMTFIEKVTINSKIYNFHNIANEHGIVYANALLRVLFKLSPPPLVDEETDSA